MLPRALIKGFFGALASLLTFVHFSVHPLNAADPESSIVPIQMVDDHAFVATEVNGVPVRLMLDTGATHLVLGPTVAARAGLSSGAGMQFETFGGARGSARLGQLHTVRVGALTLDRVPTATVALPGYFQDGLLGLPFLRRTPFALDYEKGILTLGSAARQLAKPLGRGLKLNTDRMLTVEVQVDGAPARLVIDTGAGQEVILRHRFVERRSLRKRHPDRLKVVTGGNLLGLMRGEICRLDSLRIGPHTMPHVFAEFEDAAGAAETDVDGVIGAGLLRRFHVIMDVAAKRLWLEPNSRFGSQPRIPPVVRSGLVCGPDWVVVDLVPGSPAQEAGVLVGDRVLSVNGKGVDQLRFEEFKDTLRAPPGTAVDLSIQSSGATPRTVRILLRDLL